MIRTTAEVGAALSADRRRPVRRTLNYDSRAEGQVTRLSVAANHALRSDRCAVDAHRCRVGLSASDHTGFEGVRERIDQRISGRCDRRMCPSDSEIADALCEVELVMMLRDDDLRCARSCGRGCGASAAVVNDSGHAREQRLLIHFSDR